MPGFSQLGSSLDKNNQKLRGPHSKMNDSHLVKGVGEKIKDVRYKEMSNSELEEFKKKITEERKQEVRRNISIIATLLLLIIVIVLLIVF